MKITIETDGGSTLELSGEDFATALDFLGVDGAKVLNFLTFVTEMDTPLKAKK